MKPWYSITNRASDNVPSEIAIMGDIGKGWYGEQGVEVEAFARDLAAIPQGTPINLLIHSRGGDVFDGLAIYNLLLPRSQDITSKILGAALSAASYIAMAAHKVEMPASARMMIHGAQGIAAGDSKAMQEMADLLSRESDNIAAIYARKTGKSVAKMRELMDATTWMNGHEAKALGLVDVVTDAAPQNMSAMNLSIFRCVPEELKNQKQSASNGGEQRDEMNKKLILALLGKHGVTPPENAADEALMAELDKLVVTNKVTKAEREEAAKPETVSAPAPSLVITNLQAQMADLQAKYEGERKTRISNRLHSLAADREIEVSEWLPKVLNDESLLGIVEKLPTRAAVDPSRPRVENLGNSLIEDYNKMRPGKARSDFRVQNYGDLQAVRRRHDPRNANTLAAGLVNDFLSDAVLTVFTNKLAMVDSFSSRWSTDPMRPRASVDVTKATAGATTITNPTSFEAGDSTLAAITVTMTQYSQPFHLDNNAIQQGYELRNLAEINALAMANSISDVITALIIVGTFGTALTIGTAANFDSADLAPILAAAKNYRRKNLLLDGGHLAYLLPTSTQSLKWQEGGAFGFDGIFEQNRWTSATANTAGFVCSPDAIGVASGLPVNDAPPGEFLTMGTAQLLNGLTVGTRTWFSRSTRFHWASYDIVFGAAVGDAGAGEVLITA